MKKSLLALAALGAFAGAASAQSSVTVYGLVDVAAQKGFAANDKTIGDTALGSRLGFKGVEDLGGGLAANFVFEHRFNPGTGAVQSDKNSTNQFWKARSTVGLSGAFGAIDLGRDYSVNFLMVQNTIDPFGGDTIGISRDVGMRANAKSAVRYNSQAEYHFGANGFNLGAQIAGSNEQVENAPTAGHAVKPWSVAANYGMGPIYVAAGYQRDANGIKTWDIGGKYNLGFLTLTAGYSQAKLLDNLTSKAGLVGAIIPVGSGNIKVVYDKANGIVDNKVTDYKGGVGYGVSRFAVGYDYILSKRTRLFVDAGRDSKIVNQKVAYDLGIAHSF